MGNSTQLVEWLDSHWYAKYVKVDIEADIKSHGNRETDIICNKYKTIIFDIYIGQDGNCYSEFEFWLRVLSNNSRDKKQIW